MRCASGRGGSRGRDAGVRFIDTANVYGTLSVFDQPGAPADRESAETILGSALRGRRDAVVLATKSGEPRQGPGAGLSCRHIMEQVEISLRRLQTDRVDVYYAHMPDPHTPLEQTLSTYDDLIRQGKIRYAALSNHPAWQVTQALWIADVGRLHAPVAVQAKYSLLDGSVESAIAPSCAQFGLSIVAYSPLHGGLLAGTSVLERPVSGRQRFAGGGVTREEVRVAREVERLGREWGLLPHELSLAWLLSRPQVASAIVGAETAAEITANARAGDVTLTSEQLDTLSALTAAV